MMYNWWKCLCWVANGGESHVPTDGHTEPVPSRLVLEHWDQDHLNPDTYVPTQPIVDRDVLVNQYLMFSLREFSTLAFFSFENGSNIWAVMHKRTRAHYGVMWHMSARRQNLISLATAFQFAKSNHINMVGLPPKIVKGYFTNHIFD